MQVQQMTLMQLWKPRHTEGPNGLHVAKFNGLGTSLLSPGKAEETPSLYQSAKAKLHVNETWTCCKASLVKQKRCLSLFCFSHPPITD